MNSPIEVMQAILDNGGAIEAWVKRESEQWVQGRVAGVNLFGVKPYFAVDENNKPAWFQAISLTDPNQKYTPLPTKWYNAWARLSAVNGYGELWEFEHRPYMMQSKWVVSHGKYAMVSFGHDPSNWENSLEERQLSALFVGQLLTPKKPRT